MFELAWPTDLSASRTEAGTGARAHTQPERERARATHSEHRRRRESQQHVAQDRARRLLEDVERAMQPSAQSEREHALHYPAEQPPLLRPPHLRDLQ